VLLPTRDLSPVLIFVEAALHAWMARPLRWGLSPTGARTRTASASSSTPTFRDAIVGDATSLKAEAVAIAIKDGTLFGLGLSDRVGEDASGY
jgi:hypothetical protein